MVLLLAALGALFVMALLWLSWQQRRLQKQWLSELTLLRQQRRLDTEAARMLGARLLTLEQRLLNSEAHVSSTLSPTPMPARSFTDAAELAASGADIDHLMEHCGLSRSEAKLIRSLHGQSDEDLTDPMR